MVRDDKVLGAIATARPGAEPFDERQIALIKAFADQADSGDPDDQQVI
jgi:GAF domain-containing protein